MLLFCTIIALSVVFGSQDLLDFGLLFAIAHMPLGIIFKYTWKTFSVGGDCQPIDDDHVDFHCERYSEAGDKVSEKKSLRDTNPDDGPFRVSSFSSDRPTKQSHVSFQFEATIAGPPRQRRSSERTSKHESAPSITTTVKDSASSHKRCRTLSTSGTDNNEIANQRAEAPPDGAKDRAATTSEPLPKHRRLKRPGPSRGYRKSTATKTVPRRPAFDPSTLHGDSLVKRVLIDIRDSSNFDQDTSHESTKEEGERERPSMLNGGEAYARPNITEAEAHRRVAEFHRLFPEELGSLVSHKEDEKGGGDTVWTPSASLWGTEACGSSNVFL